MFNPKSEAQKRLAAAAAQIAEDAIRRRPPFEAVEMYGGLDVYSAALKGVTHDWSRVVESAVAAAKFHVGGKAYRDEGAIKYLADLDQQIRPLLKAVRAPISGDQWLARERFGMKERKELVRTELQARFPDYSLTKEFFDRVVPGVMVFTKPFLEASRLFIAVSLGSGKSSGTFECHFGLERPFYSQMPGSFYFSHILGAYHAPEDLQEIVRKNLSLLDPLLPVFADRVRQAIGGFDLGREEGPNDLLHG